LLDSLLQETRMLIRIIKCLLCLLLISKFTSSKSDVEDRRYILYDVNMGEGFNLRRDVFMRIAVMVRKLNLNHPHIQFTLVLPPWGNLYHWQSRELGPQSKLPWSLFFNVGSISAFVPVIEFSEYLEEVKPRIEQVYYLQGYKGGWKDGKYEEKYEIADCLEKPVYREDNEGFAGYFWDYRDVRADKFSCLSVQGSTNVLESFIVNNSAASIMLDRGENLLHDYFGDANYWGIRRAMQFSSQLINIANKFRETELSSTDVEDDTEVATDWRLHRAGRRVRGGPYACVHLRRKDYVRARAGQIPSLEGAAQQLRKKLKEHELSVLYVATDAPQSEFKVLQDSMQELKVIQFRPAEDIHRKYKDGGVAILDQIICSKAKYFIGSYESTFTFRIQEEREIMGFPVKSTFDMLCADGKEKCEKGSQWKIDWGPPNHDWTITRKALRPKSEL